MPLVAPAAPTTHDVAPAALRPAPYVRAPGLIGGISHWIHQHRDAPKHGAGLWVYQIVRSAFACIPYGLSMASVLAGFAAMERKGGKMAAEAVEGTFKHGFGSRLAQFAKTPAAKMSALIGASFTFYRGSSKLAKWMTEYLFNPNDSEQRTNEKVRDLPHEMGRKIKEIAPAEVSSTPIAAIVLGFLVSAFQKPSPEALKVEVNGIKKSIDWTAANFKATQGLGNKLKLMWDAVFHPKAKFVEQAVINTLGYSLFFEMGDRLYKDVQIRRGVWPGEYNSIKALKASPDDYNAGIQQDNSPVERRKYADSALEAKPEPHHYSLFTAEPSLARFAFRRVLPTAASITAYTALKMRAAGMAFNDFQIKPGKILPQIPKLWGTEGLATVLFFMIPIVSENWEKAYDNFFNKLEKKAQAKDVVVASNDNATNDNIRVGQLNPHQVAKYEELLGRVNEKENAPARA